LLLNIGVKNMILFEGENIKNNLFFLLLNNNFLFLSIYKLFFFLEFINNL
jgi:hypothetical protein